MTRSLARFATLALSVAALMTTAEPAHAAAVQSYMYITDGYIAGIDPVLPNYPIHFLGQYTSQMMTTPGTFALGTITTNPLPTGATLSYSNTPFTIDLSVASAANSDPNFTPSPVSSYSFPTAYTYQINGVLNGSLEGEGTSTLFPTITSITGSGSIPPFDPSDLKFNLQGIAAPDGYTSGVTTLTASVAVAGSILPSPAPEPTSVAIFAAALAGFAWHRRRTRITRSLPSPTNSA